MHQVVLYKKQFKHSVYGQSSDQVTAEFHRSYVANYLIKWPHNSRVLGRGVFLQEASPKLLVAFKPLASWKYARKLLFSHEIRIETTVLRQFSGHHYADAGANLDVASKPRR